MDNTTQFVLIAKRILRELSALNQVVSALLLRIQEQIESIAKQQHPEDEREHTPPVLRAELQIPEAIKGHWERENTKKVRREWFAIGVSVATLFGVIGYALINYHMLGQMKEAAKAAKISAGAAQSAAETAHDTLIASNRPWIVVERMTATSPLIFLPNGRANINLSFHLKNVGHSVASGIYLRPYLMAHTFDNMWFTTPFARQTEWCDKVRKETPNPNALKTLFPNDDTWEPMGLELTKEEIDSSSATYPLKELRGKFIDPLVYGCVNYKFPFSKDVHQTRFMFSISRPFYKNNKIVAGKGLTAPIIIGRDVPVTELIIEKYFFGGTFAD